MISFFNFWLLLELFWIAHDRSPVPILGTFAMIPRLQAGQQTLDHYFAISSKREGEGCCTTACAAEAPDFNADLLHQLANCGHPPPEDYGPCQHIPVAHYTSVQKRSYRRACARALQNGYTWYHGRMATPQDFPQSLIQTCAMRCKPNRVGMGRTTTTISKRSTSIANPSMESRRNDAGTFCRVQTLASTTKHRSGDFIRDSMELHFMLE